MKPILVVGLGNELAGDDGVARYVLESLAADCPDEVEMLWAGTDLLRRADDLVGRRHVVLVDAVLGGPAPGRVRVWEEPWENLDRRAPHPHHLSAIQSIALLRVADPRLGETRFVLFGVGAARVESSSLSPQLATRVADITRQLRGLLASLSSGIQPEASPRS